MNAMDHKYWQMMDVKSAAIETLCEKEQFLTLVAKGFYAVSLSSPLAFKRVFELSPHEEAKELAKEVYEVEMGMHPLVDNPLKNIPHAEQFRLLLSSLQGSDINKNILNKSAEEFLSPLKLEEADLQQALATCDVIEHIAPRIISCFQDLVAQWQVFTKTSSDQIERTFLDEHSLTEDDKSPEQHIEMVNKLLRPHKEIVNTKEYKEKKSQYHRAIIDHLDRVVAQIEQL